MSGARGTFSEVSNELFQQIAVVTQHKSADAKNAVWGDAEEQLLTQLCDWNKLLKIDNELKNMLKSIERLKTSYAEDFPKPAETKSSSIFDKISSIWKSDPKPKLTEKSGLLTKGEFKVTRENPYLEDIKAIEEASKKLFAAGVQSQERVAFELIIINQLNKLNKTLPLYDASGDGLAQGLRHAINPLISFYHRQIIAVTEEIAYYEESQLGKIHASYQELITGVLSALTEKMQRVTINPLKSYSAKGASFQSADEDASVTLGAGAGRSAGKRY